MSQGHKILFVCTGNTCRSYMAETIAKNYLSTLGAEVALEIISAGTGCLDEELASLQARTVMSEMGCDNNAHRAKRLTPAMVKEADLVLAMTQRQRSDILKLAPEAGPKVFLLKEYAISIAEHRRRAEEMAVLRQQINTAEKEFFAQHRGAISDLEFRKRQLLQELNGVEEKLDEWERLLSKVALDKKQELAKLEEVHHTLEIMDPFGQPVEYYRVCAQEIAPLVARALDRYLGKDTDPSLGGSAKMV